ncbi:hypothetical protein FHW84_003549 [Dyella sp. SG562]|uniref:hypothetical protein n=1 Tax=Dyella sp. SG562 TaxID=2587017 RepID=UPI00141E673D|nr:hypothetical protein [Dyella sp. SG562]NII74952.1 hypothetical protein [Dyella sp. SG562]
MKNFPKAVKESLRRIPKAYNAAGLAVFGMLSSSAFAQGTGSDMTGAFSTEVAGGKGQLYTIGGIVLTLCAVALLISMGKRSAR